MESNHSLYEGRLIRLAPLDHVQDPPVVAGWTADPTFRPVLGQLISPLSAEAVKKKWLKLEKQMEEEKNLFIFSLHLRADDRLVGFARIFWIDFHHGTGALTLGLGDPADRRHGYGADALTLLLRFAFGELNLHRLSAWASADNQPFLELLRQAGFEEEACRREAAFHAGSYWDVHLLGLLRSDWEVQA